MCRSICEDLGPHAEALPSSSPGRCTDRTRDTTNLLSCPLCFFDFFYLSFLLSLIFLSKNLTRAVQGTKEGRWVDSNINPQKIALWYYLWYLGTVLSRVVISIQELVKFSIWASLYLKKDFMEDLYVKASSESRD